MAELRCYRCGRIKPGSKSMEARLKIQTGGDGWREAEIDTRQSVMPAKIPRLGTDPATLCPRCKEEKPC